jgi:hypothetical protein
LALLALKRDEEMGDVCFYDVPHAEVDAMNVPKRDHVQISVEESGLVSCHCLYYDISQ